MTINHPTPLDTDAVPCRRDPERMFPTGNGGARIAQDERAKSVCNRGDNGRPCHLRDRCLAYALRYDVSGVWGGTTESERQEFRDANGLDAISIATQSVRHLVYGKAS